MLNITSWLLGVMQHILDFESGSSGMFIGVARAAMTSVGVVLVIMFGLRAIKSVELGQAYPMGGYIHIGFQLGVCFAVVGSWVSPAPGLGQPLGTFIPNLGIRFAQMVGWSGAQDIAQNITSWSGMEAPGLFFSTTTLYWLLAQVVLLLATILLACVLVGPLAIVAVLIILGPLFIPMWPLPELTAHARGYLRCLITYSLVPVIAATCMRVIAQVILPSVAQMGTVVTSVEAAVPQVFMLLISLVATIFAMLSCVRVANHITSGSSGSGTGWMSAGFTAIRMLL